MRFGLGEKRKGDVGSLTPRSDDCDELTTIGELDRINPTKRPRSRYFLLFQKIILCNAIDFAEQLIDDKNKKKQKIDFPSTNKRYHSFDLNLLEASEILGDVGKKSDRIKQSG